jgi:DNA-binding transcriptional MerR regulator
MHHIENEFHDYKIGTPHRYYKREHELDFISMSGTAGHFVYKRFRYRAKVMNGPALSPVIFSGYFRIRTSSPNTHQSATVEMNKLLDAGISKLYYTISEVAATVDEEAHVLRYWETEFKQLRPKKNKAGKRIYTRTDIDIVFRIRHLLRDDKFTLEGARQALAAKSSVTSNSGEMTGDLANVRSLLSQMLDRVKED